MCSYSHYITISLSINQFAIWVVINFKQHISVLHCVSITSVSTFHYPLNNIWVISCISIHVVGWARKVWDSGAHVKDWDEGLVNPAELSLASIHWSWVQLWLIWCTTIMLVGLPKCIHMVRLIALCFRSLKWSYLVQSLGICLNYQLHLYTPVS